MNQTIADMNSSNLTRAIKFLFLVVFVAASLLSFKAVYDMTEFNIFPTWFVPGFALGVLMLAGICLYFCLQLQKIQNASSQITAKNSVLLWILMPLSFVCTTAVHGFYPFHKGGLSVFMHVDPVMRINFMLALLGFAVSAVLACMYIFTNLKSQAILGLLILSLITLIPNDQCYNPFNYWWIEHVGASPLMYTPNLYVSMFITAGLFGVRPKSGAFLAICACIGTLALGVGHQVGILW